MKVLGISPLDKDATVSLVENDHVLFAAGEERFSRRKQHAGFPNAALDAAFEATNTKPEEIDRVVYAFLDAEQEAELMARNIAKAMVLDSDRDWRAGLREVINGDDVRTFEIPGLSSPEQRISKGWFRDLLYVLLGAAPVTSRATARWLARDWTRRSAAAHRHWQRDLESNLRARGLLDKLQRFDHHLSHAANAYYGSGYERALILTLDGYGTGLSGTVGLGEGGNIKRLHSFTFPNSMGTFYENVTSALGFEPDRHAGKIVGLAAYGDPSRLSPVILDRIELDAGDFRVMQPINYFFERYLASRFPMIDVAAAYQHVLEIVAAELTRHWLDKTGCDAVVLSGGVAANVKMNQRIFEIEGVKQIFIYPNMGDGGCATGLALHVGDNPRAANGTTSVYLGPAFTEREIERTLEAADLAYERPNNLAAEVAKLIHDGKVVARFDGRMEYGPRALGNRSILYHGRDPAVNQWLNKRLGRTEFMPFAPVTLWETRHRYYHNLDGADHAAEFMTITFDCTDRMKRECPAAVHVDGTARPQLIKRDINPGYYDIIVEYQKLAGSSTMINTSFNLHEEPIVCSPADAVRAFLEGNLDAMAIGPYLVDSAP